MPVLSQGLNQVLAAQAKPTTGEDRLLVDAKEIIYNNDKNTIAASGDVQLNYQGRSLQADRGDLRPEYRSGLRRGPRQVDGRKRRGPECRPLRTDGRFQERFHQFAKAGPDLGRRRPKCHHPVLGPPGGACRRRDHHLRTWHLHGLRTLQGSSGKTASLAGEGRQDYPQHQRADDLLRRRHHGGLRIPGRLPALFLDAGPNGEAQDRLSGARLRDLELARFWRLGAFLLGHRAELRPDPQPHVPEPPRGSG